MTNVLFCTLYPECFEIPALGDGPPAERGGGLRYAAIEASIGVGALTLPLFESTTLGLKADRNGGKETSSAAPYTSSAKRTSSPSSLCVRSNATVVGEGERLEALARGESPSSETSGEPTLRHMT